MLGVFPKQRVRSLHVFVVTVMLIVCNVLVAEDTVPTAAQIDFFEKSIRPLLVQHCYECHSAAETNGGLLLDSRDGWQKGGDSGAVIVAGDPDKSLLIEAIRYQNRDMQMPPQNPLSRQQIQKFEKWVAMGAPDPREATTVQAGSAAMSIEDGRRFWSFRPVSNPAVPTLRNQPWVRTPIDAFILAELAAQGLQPAPPADRATLIRRVTFDLIGLPPTPAEIDAFVADQAPNAFENVVERLLASPHYGVRWGRHWLDVARYADSNGLDENLAYGNAWRYRDYVIAAFNNDKPFDRFLIEQLAGDLLPHADRETRIATGFLALGAKVLAEPDREKLVMDVIDEQLDTIGKTFLGMTFGCVRCHDHKFDPLKQSDYYALAAIFKSTKTLGDTNTGAIKHWYEYSFATDQQRESLKNIDAAIAAKKKAAADFKNKSISKLRADARSKATEYLVAATRFLPDAPLTSVAEIAATHDLHPRILHHCRLHLHYQRDDAFLGKWDELKDDPNAVRAHYGSLFERAEDALAEGRKNDPKTKQLADVELEGARAALDDLNGFLTVPAKAEFAFDEQTLAEYDRLMEEARLVESNAADEAAAMGVTDGEVTDRLPIHIRGSHLNLGEPIMREFPQVMRTSLVRPILPSNQSGRLEFARWLASTRHPLTARVYVNRIWRWHFGRGIVKSTENFGELGDRPTHPELLDWLAYHFMQSGWSTKDLHRLILASSVYQMSSQVSDNARTADPENLRLSRFILHRLEAEQIRDSLLAVSGRLDEALGGKTVPLRNRQFVFNHTSVDHTKYDSLRRAAYLPLIRNNVYTLFEQFDFPDPTMPTGNRNSTVVAPQALLMMNSELVMDSAEALAEQLLASEADDESRVARLYRRTLGREPNDAETDRALAFITELTSPGADQASAAQVSRPRRLSDRRSPPTSRWLPTRETCGQTMCGVGRPAQRERSDNVRGRETRARASGQTMCGSGDPRTRERSDNVRGRETRAQRERSDNVRGRETRTARAVRQCAGSGDPRTRERSDVRGRETRARASGQTTCGVGKPAHSVATCGAGKPPHSGRGRCCARVSLRATSSFT